MTRGTQDERAAARSARARERLLAKLPAMARDLTMPEKRELLGLERAGVIRAGADYIWRLVERA